MTVKSAERALQVLELLATHEQPLSFTRIGQELNVPASSLHSLLGTLTTRGWIEQDELTRRYSLGIQALAAGNAYSRSFKLPERAQPIMAAIRDELDETVQLAVLVGRYNVYVAKVDGHQPLTLASQVGRQLPAHATGLGKVLLADLTPQQLTELLSPVALERFTDQTITTLPALRRCLQDITRSGYGTDREEYTIGVRCVAVPVRDHTGRAVAAMSVSVPTARLDRELWHRALRLLVDGSRRLSNALGYTGDLAHPPEPGTARRTSA